ncbi:MULTISPECIES: hypothetical protein [unclassified Pseudomonas]|uniref:hypothetical protein n=1 Tax=unclassified Pseudomonas TaxID=196821 RepID=UPI001F58C12D|nr:MULTISPECIES: hypothetical protein [unclassified Pseudomonas]
MSDDPRTGTEIPDNPQPDEESSLPVTGMEKDDAGALVAPLEFRYPNSTIQLDPVMGWEFKLPTANDGRIHNVRMDFHSQNGDFQELTRAMFSGGIWRTAAAFRHEETPSGHIAWIDGQWDYEGKWSSWARQPVVIRKAARFDSASVVSTHVSGWARKGSVITLKSYTPDKVLSETVTVEANEIWNVKLERSLPQGPYEIYIREGFAGALNRHSATKKFFVLNPLTITRPSVSDLIKPIISGTGGMSGATAVVYAEGVAGALIESPISSDGNWSGTSKISLNLGQTYKLSAVQIYDGATSEISAPFEMALFGAPRITSPLSGSLLDSSFLLKGVSGILRAQLEVLPASGGKPYGFGSVTKANGEWEIEFKDVAFGKISLVVVQIFNNDRSDPSQTLSLQIRPPVLLIAGPPAQSEQNTSFTLTGKGAVANATLKIFKDLVNSPPLISIPGVASGDWSVPLAGLEPGVLSLVAVQEVDGIASTPSTLRSFNIRPPMLSNPVVEYPTENTIKFSGSGHNRATVHITIDSGPGATLPPSVEVANGIWETIATNWPVGTYKLKIVQKFPIGSDGWIESLPLEFTLNNALPDVSDLKHTPEYRPTFSGKGFNGATVHVRHPSSPNLAAPTKDVVGNEWSTTASVVWGPSNNREVHVKQILNNQWSPTWEVLKVTIFPLAPGLNIPSEEGLSPVFSGTGWSGAEVYINFSGDLQTYKVTVVADVWTFQRPTPFSSNTPHTIEVHQVAEELESPKAKRTFTVYPVIEQPVITYPLDDSEVHRDLIVTGLGGMAGATMQLWDDRFQKYLTPAQPVLTNGEWSIDLKGLAFDEHVIRAEQTIYALPPKRSERCNFKAVVLPPEITRPDGGEKLSRTSELSGKGMPHARVEVWMLGDTSAPLTEADVDGEGNWRAEVTLPVGDKTIWALQVFHNNGDPQTSKDSDPVTYQVVPKAPDIESPTQDDHAGRVLVVSGFGVSGDTVTVKVGSSNKSALVKADRTWWVKLELDQPGGDSLLEVVSALGEFESDPATRPIVLRTYEPTIEIPAAGTWVTNPVSLAGNGREGVGTVVSWFNPDLVLTANISVDPVAGWQAQAGPSLMTGGQWSLFRQSLNDSEKGSDWVDSARYEVEPVSAKPS